jgi:hypothetical protein
MISRTAAFNQDAGAPARCIPTQGDQTMLTKTVIALSAAIVVVTSLVSAADAQRAPRQAVYVFTDAERNWFEIPEAPERLPK